MPALRALLLAVPLLVAHPGCGTVASIDDEVTAEVANPLRRWRSLVFSGVRYDLNTYSAEFILFPTLSRIQATLDLPFSLVLDAAFLPLTATHHAVQSLSDRPAVRHPPPPRSPRPHDHR